VKARGGIAAECATGRAGQRRWGMEGARERPIPLWALALAGWMLAAALRERSTVTEREPAPPVRLVHPGALGHLSARELRALPGLGEKRALALVDARWERSPGDPPLLLGDLAGIGGVVESAVRAALLSNGALSEDAPSPDALIERALDTEVGEDASR